MSAGTPETGPLNVARVVLRGLRALNIVYAAGILGLLIASLLAEGPVMSALGVKPGDGAARLILGARAIMLVGIAGAVITHVVLGHLMAMVDTVRAGDPFIAGNVRRLRLIAGWVLVAEVIRLAVGGIAGLVSSPGQRLDLDSGVSFVPWLAVLLLFVLAKVFEQGTRMRADLEGTV